MLNLLLVHVQQLNPCKNDDILRSIVGDDEKKKTERSLQKNVLIQRMVEEAFGR